MQDFLSLMLPAFTVCLVLVGIHAYLGIHVLARGVIFVDLALAQIAAFGTTLAFLAGFALDSQVAYLVSLGFTFLGAAIFAFTRVGHEHIPQEAIIGISYAVASAATILAVDRAPHGAEHIKALLVGAILWVSWPTILKTAVIYLLVGLFHWLFRHRFLLISFDPQQARDKGLLVRLWDFLFYASFGLVITISVQIAGVLLVFSFLIVPGVCGILFSNRFSARLVIGWVIATLVSMLGCVLSYQLDLPTGATVVCTFGGVLILLALLKRLRLV